MAAADAVDLQFVARAHDGGEQAIPHRRIGGKIRGEEVGAARSPAAHQDTGNGRHPSRSLEVFWRAVSEGAFLQLYI